jgi:TfoX/Sxy family transcriptional regulator of competence genes
MTMATTQEFIEYVCAQVADSGAVRSKKMFGEYMVYVNDRPILLVCDNTVFVKMLPEIAALMGEVETGFPYNGAKEHYVLDIDNAAHARTVVAALLPIVPIPKPRKKKG